MEHVAEDLAVTSETARHQPVDGVDLTKVQKPVGAGAPKYTNPRRTRAVVTLSVLVVTLVTVTIVSAGLGQYNIPTDQVLASFARNGVSSRHSRSGRSLTAPCGMCVSRACF